MSSFQIIVGSMLGGTEYVAEACEETLNTLNHQATVHLQPKFEQIPTKNQTWLICSSTHGAGDLPDNIQNFFNDLRSCGQDLSSISFFVIAVGDSNYDTFCQAGIDIEKTLLSKGCNKKIAFFTIDMSQDIDPEDLAQQWILTNKDLL